VLPDTSKIRACPFTTLLRPLASMFSILAHGDRVAHPALRGWTRAWRRA
jgi:hypothetical protein